MGEFVDTGDGDWLSDIFVGKSVTHDKNDFIEGGER